MKEGVLHYFPNHPLSEVRHVLLCKRDGRTSGNVLGKLASEHAAVAAVHLLRDVFHDFHLKPFRIQLLALFVPVFIL